MLGVRNTPVSQVKNIRQSFKACGYYYLCSVKAGKHGQCTGMTFIDACIFLHLPLTTCLDLQRDSYVHCYRIERKPCRRKFMLALSMSSRWGNLVIAYVKKKERARRNYLDNAEIVRGWVLCRGEREKQGELIFQREF